MRRYGPLLAGFLMVIAATALAVSYWSKPSVLKVAVGPLGSEDARLIAGLAPAVQREKGAIRLKMALAEDAKAAAQMLDDGKVDLAVARSDVALPRDGLTALVLRRAYAVIVSRGDSGLARVADLRGKTIGVHAGAPENERLLRTILAQYELPADAVTLVRLESGDRSAALAERKIDALFLVGSPLSRPAADAVAALARAVGEPGLSFMAIREAAAIAARDAALEESELVMGAFGGEPPRPPEAIPTVSISYRLMASRHLSDATVGDVTRIILTARQQILADVPSAQGIEAPSTDKNAPLPAHPGAAAYVDGEQETFFEKYGDWFYLGVMAFSILGSGAAAILSRMSTHRRADAMAGLTRLLAILRETRGAEDEARLTELEAEADAILSRTLEHAAAGDLDEAGLSA